MTEDVTRLPSPDRQASVFVFHEAAPERVVRVPMVEDWETFLEMVRGRLKLRTSEVVMDTSTGANHLVQSLWTPSSLPALLSEVTSSSYLLFICPCLGVVSPSLRLLRVVNSAASCFCCCLRVVDGPRTSPRPCICAPFHTRTRRA